MPTDHRLSEPVEVLLFSILREKVGASRVLVEIDAPESAATFLARLGVMLPPIAEFTSAARLAVNGRYADGADAVSPGDEVAVITPVSGG